MFREIMRGELWRYMRRELANSINVGLSDDMKLHVIYQKLLDAKMSKLLFEVERMGRYGVQGSTGDIDRECSAEFQSPASEPNQRLLQDPAANMVPFHTHARTHFLFPFLFLREYCALPCPHRPI